MDSYEAIVLAWKVIQISLRLDSNLCILKLKLEFTVNISDVRAALATNKNSLSINSLLIDSWILSKEELLQLLELSGWNLYRSISGVNDGHSAAG